MKKNSPAFIFFLIISSVFIFSSCDKINDIIDPETETEKVTRIFVEGSPWHVDTLTYKEDFLSGSQSVVTYDTSYFNYGTLEFTDPDASENPGYNCGYMIHRYSENGQAKIDSMAWAPYNHNSGSDNHITIFIHDQNSIDFVVGAWDMYLDKIIIGENKVKVEGWRRENAGGTSGGIYGNFRGYTLSRD
ncbi:MAG TPA: hypothetical protein PLW31_06625 [Bacteroidales bacterium]|jgi:hypothetical protein|nr:hypothetical protein [Bacteroidales bacterium]HOX77698.1 hypothetical protein [Bacteroidales bacterium]HPI85261.1 hypothetical protein [Bacteroidales bacterium]HPM92720.1 hypothetical protein [Bacteroidales bacterium]